MQNSAISSISQQTATTYTFDFPRTSTKSVAVLALLVVLLMNYTVTMTFNFAAVIIVLLTSFKAVIARRIFARENWLGIYIVSAVLSAINLNVAGSASPSLILGGLAGLMGAIDISTWRIAEIAKKGHTIEISNRMEIVVNVFSYLLLFYACSDGIGLWPSIISGSIVGWVCGYVASLRGNSQLLVSPEIDITVVHVENSRTGLVQNLDFAPRLFQKAITVTTTAWLKRRPNSTAPTKP